MAEINDEISFVGPLFVSSLRTDDASEVPPMPGVYVWRRILNVPRLGERSREQLVQELRKQAESPIAVFSEVKVAPNYNKETGGLEKLITKARKNMPLKTHEDCIHCLQHLQASRVAYFYNK